LIELKEEAVKAEQRYRYILLKTYWEGEINRAELVDKFGISQPQSTKDLAHVKKNYPGAIQYDSTLMAYVPGRTINRHVSQYSFDEYYGSSRSHLGNAYIIEPPARKIDQKIYRFIHQAIKHQSGIDILYRSLKNPSPQKKRTIFPHSVVRSGFRWHLRAYELQSNSFKDFNLSRIVKVFGFSDTACSASQIENDKSWNEVVTLMLTPNFAYDVEQRKVIASDYTGVEDMAIILKVKAADLLYTLHLYEVRDFTACPPRNQLLQIGNFDSITKYLPS
jgi:hypothetical protein